jgi:hypothetical protein
MCTGKTSLGTSETLSTLSDSCDRAELQVTLLPEGQEQGLHFPLCSTRAPARNGTNWKGGRFWCRQGMKEVLTEGSEGLDTGVRLWEVGCFQGTLIRPLVSGVVLYRECLFFFFWQYWGLNRGPHPSHMLGRHWITSSASPGVPKFQCSTGDSYPLSSQKTGLFLKMTDYL